LYKFADINLFASKTNTMQLILTNDLGYSDEIAKLYVEAFSTGLSQQYIDLAALTLYIEMMLKEGSALLAIENNTVCGAILSCPLKFDKLLPPEIRRKFCVQNCIYLAEMMVGEEKRGQGVGKKMMSKFLETIDKSLFTDAFIRVWEENIPALNLYKKMGFEPISSIEQTKTKANGIGTFVMRKIYLHKKLY
jgi:diamine N-acetyltransferase